MPSPPMSTLDTARKENSEDYLESGEWTLIPNNGLKHKEKNPIDTGNCTGPIICNGTSLMLNKHKKEHQSLISTFFRSKAWLDNETKKSILFQIETKNLFTSLIDEEFSNLSDLDNVYW